MSDFYENRDKARKAHALKAVRSLMADHLLYAREQVRTARTALHTAEQAYAVSDTWADMMAVNAARTAEYVSECRLRDIRNLAAESNWHRDPARYW